MNQKKIITVMTYEQWEKQFKRNVKRYCRRKRKELLEGLSFAAMILLLFGGMIAYWIIFGY